MQSSQDPHAPEMCRFDPHDFKLDVQFSDYNGKSPCINRKHDYILLLNIDFIENDLQCFVDAIH